MVIGNCRLHRPCPFQRLWSGERYPGVK